MAAAVRSLRPDRRWQATQLSRGPAHGRVLAFACDKAQFTATELIGTVDIRGVVSEDSVVLGLGLALSRGYRQWFESGTRGMALLMAPGSMHSGVYIEHSSYISMDMSREALLAEADLLGVALKPDCMSVSRILPGAVDPAWLQWVSGMIGQLHEGSAPPLMPGVRFDEVVMAGLLMHLSQGSRHADARPAATRHARIVQRARDYIQANLQAPIHIDALCRETRASRSALYRAFEECLGETPQAYVLKLRLNRIREELASPAEATRTVATVSHKWGIPELGRLAASYREQFGELPSQTLRRRQVAGRALP